MAARHYFQVISCECLAPLARLVDPQREREAQAVEVRLGLRPTLAPEDLLESPNCFKGSLMGGTASKRRPSAVEPSYVWGEPTIIEPLYHEPDEWGRLSGWWIAALIIAGAVGVSGIVTLVFEAAGLAA